MAKRPYPEKELEELKEATERFHKRERFLFGAEGQRKYSREEHEQRWTTLLQQFDLIARRLLKKAKNDISKREAQVKSLQNDRESSDDLKRAELQLQLSQKLREAVVRVRAMVANEEEKEDF